MILGGPPQPNKGDFIVKRTHLAEGMQLHPNLDCALPAGAAAEGTKKHDSIRKAVLEGTESIGWAQRT